MKIDTKFDIGGRVLQNQKNCTRNSCNLFIAPFYFLYFAFAIQKNSLDVI